MSNTPPSPSFRAQFDGAVIVSPSLTFSPQEFVVAYDAAQSARRAIREVWLDANRPGWKNIYPTWNEASRVCPF